MAVKKKMADLKCSKRRKKEPLAPIIEEIKNRENFKCKVGSEIDKIAEKLKSMFKKNVEDILDKELLTCKESFEKADIDAVCESEKENEDVEQGKIDNDFEYNLEVDILQHVFLSWSAEIQGCLH